MILVAVGTSSFPFERMTEVVNKIAMMKNMPKIIYQHGYTTIKSPNPQINYVKFVDYKTFLDLIEEAEVVVTHCGAATLDQIISMGKKPLAFPRDYRFGEHINNHQIQLCKQLVDKDMVVSLDMKSLGSQINGLMGHTITRVPSINLNRMIKALDKAIL